MVVVKITVPISTNRNEIQVGNTYIQRN